MPTRPLSEALKKQAIAAVQRYGSITLAANALGVNRATLGSRLHLAGYSHTPATSASLPPLAGGVSLPELQATIDDLRGQIEAVTQVKRWVAAKSKTRPKNPAGSKHLYIPDTQIKLGVPLEHLEAAGNYAAEKRPDTIILAGDWWDFPSLSSYDKGKKSFEGRRYRLDVEAGKAGMERFLAPIRKQKRYNPRIVMTLGNHENRVNRCVEEHSILDGTIGIHDLQLEAFGVEAHQFLKPVVIDGVSYCHYFPRSASGKVMQDRNGAPNALAQLRREGRSCVAGHVQGFDIACLPFSGRLQWGIQAGSFYQHQETYLTPQGQDHWHGVLMLHEVNDGCFSPMVVSLDYLMGKYL
jgi:hypothetical protein